MEQKKQGGGGDIVYSLIQDANRRNMDKKDKATNLLGR